MHTLDAHFTRWKKQGRRMTRARTGILNLFLTMQGPLTVDALCNTLRKRKIAVDRSTVYRELHFLTQEGLLTEGNDGKKRWWEWRANPPHHHLHCQQCGRVQEFQMDETWEAFTRWIRKKGHFTLAQTSLELTGLCAHCVHP